LDLLYDLAPLLDTEILTYHLDLKDVTRQTAKHAVILLEGVT